MPTLIGETLNSCIASCTVREGAAPPAVVDMTRKWRNIDEFREKWSPANLNEWALTMEEKCLLSRKSPTLGMLETGYGIKAAMAWLAMQLMTANKLLGLTEERRLDSTQCMNLAAGIIKEYPCLKVSELWVFLRKWSTGGCGKKVYGAVDPTELGSDISKFIVARREMEVREMRREAAEKAAREAAEVDGRIKELCAMRGSKEWDGLPEERRRSIESYLRYYGKI